MTEFAFFSIGVVVGLVFYWVAITDRKIIEEEERRKIK